MVTDSIDTKKEVLKNLVNVYEYSLPQLRKPQYNETLVRVDFINPFFQLLGWDVMNEQGLPQHLREVVHEATVEIEDNGKLKSKKPDYSFRIGTETLFFLETKKPSVDINIDSAPAFQLRRYGWSGNLKISLLSNFTDLYIYDCSIRPIEGDDINTALVAHYHYTEYVECFEELYSLLSKDAVLSGEFEENFGNIQGAFRQEPFDEYFLEQIKDWRYQLGQDILFNCPNVDSETLNIFVQRILNRIIFLRICEDRNLANYESLKEITTYEELKSLFIVADRKYDSGLFELLDEDRLMISDELIIEIFKSLYYPNNSYEFSVIDPFIIGQIYELFLSEALEIDENGNLIVTTKPEVVDIQGAVNTPKYISDRIVEETLSPLFVGKKPIEIEDIHIADICCGSGNFLLSAFEYICNYYIEYFQENDYEGAIQRGDIYPDTNNEYLIPGNVNITLSYKLKRKILKNMIYGVDIDPLAVEVAKFSLLIKVLEDTSEEEIEAYHIQTHNRVLPNLEENIKLGNSLVDSLFANYDSSVYNDPDLMNKIKMFDWQVEFEFPKFDAIVGNPPYIRVQNMVQYSPEEYQYYKSGISGYRTAKASTLDKYYLFVERALMLLNIDGMLGYIIPNKFMSIESGAELRDLLSSNSNVKKIYHFGTLQVFKNRSTYTCILILSKSPSDSFDIAYIKDLNRFIFEHACNYTTYSSSYLSREPWALLPETLTDQLENIASNCIPLSEIADIFVGVQTSADDIYVVHADQEDDLFIYGHERNGDKFQIEKGILRKSIYDAKLISYEKIQANSYIIFPYYEYNGKPKLYSPEEMATNFPFAFNYLQRHKEKLDNRSMNGRTENNWYAYGRSQNIRRFMSGEHLVWPVLSIGPNYVYDDEMIVFTGGGNGPYYGLEMKKGCQLSILYIQAILNYWLIEDLVKSKASAFGGGYYSHAKEYISNLPIYMIDFNNAFEVETYDKIIEEVKLLMQLKLQMSSSPNNTQRVILERAVNNAERDLQALIDKLYNISYEENEETL